MISNTTIKNPLPKYLEKNESLNDHIERMNSLYAEKKTNNNDIGQLDSTLDSSISPLWSKTAVEQLLHFGSKFGRKWQQVSKMIGNKTPRQCAYMYDKIITSYIRPKFQRIDDILLIEYSEKGMNWETIGKKMPAYTIEQLQTRYESVLAQKISSSSLNDNGLCKKKGKEELSLEIDDDIHDDRKNQEIDGNVSYSNVTRNKVITLKTNENDILSKPLNNNQIKIKHNNQPKDLSNDLVHKSERNDVLFSKIMKMNNKLKIIIKQLLRQNSNENYCDKYEELSDFQKSFVDILKKVIIKGNLTLNKIKNNHPSEIKHTDIVDYFNEQLKIIRLAKINANLYRGIWLLNNDVEK